MKINPKILPLLPPIVGAGFALLILYIIYKAMTRPAADTAALNNDINTNRLSYAESNYFIFADQIQTATEGAWGDDEEAIYNVFRQMNNDSDVYQLIKAFGKRTYINIHGFFYGASLSEVLTADLTAEELGKINDILAAKNISVRF